MRTAVFILAALLIIGLVFAAVVWMLQRSLLFPAPGPPSSDPSLAAPHVEKLRVGPGGVSEAWFFAPAGPESYPVLVFGHGNGELIDDWVLDFETPRRWGVGVLLVEFPGYGRSGGAPSQDAIVRAFVDAYDAIAGRDEVTEMIGYGRSLGGGAICQLARERELTALILESTFSSVTDMARGFGVPAWLVRDPFDNQSVLAAYPGPILLMHGTVDAIVPFEHAERNHAAAVTSQLYAVECGHNDCPRPWRRIRKFLEEAGIVVGRD